jgi:hypothetical protein
MCLFLHSQYVSAQMGNHVVIREKYANDDEIHMQLQC